MTWNDEGFAQDFCPTRNAASRFSILPQYSYLWLRRLYNDFLRCRSTINFLKASSHRVPLFSLTFYYNIEEKIMNTYFLIIIHKWALREMSRNTEFFLVRIFLYSVRIQENTHQKKLRIWTLFTKWRKSNLVSLWVPHNPINWMKAKAADAYTKLSQTSKRELFVEIVNGWK